MKRVHQSGDERSVLQGLLDLAATPARIAGIESYVPRWKRDGVLSYSPFAQRSAW
jgi:hypothetical protein